MNNAPNDQQQQQQNPKYSDSMTTTYVNVIYDPKKFNQIFNQKINQFIVWSGQLFEKTSQLRIKPIVWRIMVSRRQFASVLFFDI